MAYRWRSRWRWRWSSSCYSAAASRVHQAARRGEWALYDGTTDQPMLPGVAVHRNTRTSTTTTTTATRKKTNESIGYWRLQWREERRRRPQHYKYNSVWRWRWRHLVVQQRVNREAQARLGIRGTQLLLAAQNLVVMQAARVAQSVIARTHAHTHTGKGESSTTNGREGDVEDVRWRAIGALTPLQSLGHTARAARLGRLLYIGEGSRMMSRRACVNCLPCAQCGATYCATSSSTGATRGRSWWQLAVTHQHTTQVEEGGTAA